MRLSIYSDRLLYHLAMRLLYQRHYATRYEAIIAEIPAGATVVDVCAGDCYLYYKYLRQKSVIYLGLDNSVHFVRWAQRHGIAAREFNLWRDSLPFADIVVMSGSLYQFLPHSAEIVEKLLTAARTKVIIAEPIVNLASSKNRFLAFVNRRLTLPLSDKDLYRGERFDRASLMNLFYSFEAFKGFKIIAGGREILGTFRGQCTR